MSEFNQVSIVKKANIYFKGKVTSRTLRFADGSTKTLGYMLPGEYEFNTGTPEIMEVLEGDCQVLLDGQNEWKSFVSGENFEVPGKSKFLIKTTHGLDYCCSFL